MSRRASIVESNPAAASGASSPEKQSDAPAFSSRPGPSRPVCLPGEVRVFWIASLVMFCLSLVVMAMKRRAGEATALWDPLSDPLLGDLMEYPGTYRLLHTAKFFSNALPGGLPERMFSAVAYPPFAAAVLAPVYLAASPVWVFLSVAATGLATTFWYVRQTLQRSGIAGSTATLFPLSLMLISFPLQRLVHQGNVELVVWGWPRLECGLFCGKRMTQPHCSGDLRLL